ncbi:MAG: GH32 C-terminal domain-containing protein [Sedimentisphaerales bacterium]|nr:GH32 C-terminal domain-containing protein [Sedimentisphaerales bacterium]
MLRCVSFAMVLLVVSAVSRAAEPDLVIADFEGSEYGSWQVTGEAFGPGPARGTLPGQMDVSGYKGKRLVNSFFDGDGTTGTLTSTPFKIERKYIKFLIGGGMHPGETCINLVIDGKVVRTATGPNDRPGGSEALDWAGWDVADLQGRTARIQIVDRATGGWGHINIDHILQSNEKREVLTDMTREIVFRDHYLNFPVKKGAAKRLIHLLIDGQVVREFTIELASDEADYWVFLDVSPFAGRKGALRIDKYDPLGASGFDVVFQADSFPGQKDVYAERLRPQVHFTSRRGWNNDTNGMMYYDGEYHLFYQHNPYGWNWGNMTWGHAVSEDMVRWVELDDAIHPDHLGTIFSGSAVVDERNTAGFQTGDEKVLVCVYTSAGGTNPLSSGQPFTQSIAYSNDRGRSWTPYEGNPVVEHINGGNRDPKVIWHDATDQWVMVLYLDDNDMGFFTSDDLKSWQFQSKLKCFHECPELFALPVDGDPANTRWILYGGSGDYLIGQFDGKKFVTEDGPVRYHYGNCFYASQTFNNIPADDGRRLQMAWGRVSMPEMPFNQMILFPVNLTLRTTGAGLRMHAEPAREIATLHRHRRQWQNRTLEPGQGLRVDTRAELFHIQAELGVRDCRSCELTVRGVPVVYNAETRELICRDKKAPLQPVEGRIHLELIVDRTSIEIFGNHGRVYMPMGVHLVDKPTALELSATGGDARIESLNICELQSIWLLNY